MYKPEKWCNLKGMIKYITPPILLDVIRRLVSIRYPRVIEYEYMPEGWAAEQSDPKIKGWNIQSVLEAYKAGWPAFVQSLEGTQPFGVSSHLEHRLPTQNDLLFHNTMMSYAYVLTVSTRNKSSISMLDWGGGIGRYYLISQALVPELKIDYHCKDVPVFAEYGQKLFPEAHFYTDESCLTRKFDFVLASASLHYSQDWVSVLKGLSRATAGYMFVTQLPILHRSSSYVMVQRPYQCGYDTEYLGWCLNRQEFLKCAKEMELELVREFIIGYQLPIYCAPEQCEYRGFLFRSTHA